ncbi:hypothetical protein [Quadrisphaera setariae]|uniref:Uncharacterized protein n=1 Tax=Quadrisphaera setariae TaxID=2593304 RepID=A0A5C8ZHC8_9ACTN|nr:hypothetical protein [Quadrisphaera setariae]TXR57455.1 hypothetical protein FMM08_04200 [Quadrisphaera setariae]
MAVRTNGRASTPSDEERWEQALSIAQGTPTPPALDRQRRRRRDVLLWLIGLLAAASAAGFVAGLLFPDAFGGPAGNSADSDQRDAVVLVTVLVGFAVEAVGIAMLVRARQWGARWRSPVAVLTRTQRRLVLREVRGRVPAHQDHLPVSLDLARRLVSTDGLLVMFAGFSIMQLGRLVDQSGLVSTLWTSGVLALFLVAAVLVLRDRLRAQRFLDRHVPSDG